jgi:hypothetical protein
LTSEERSVDARTRGIGVAIPANNEERLLPSSLEALELSLLGVIDTGVRAHVALVLDSCRDRSEVIARQWRQHMEGSSDVGVTVVEYEGANVGQARALGCGVLLDEFRDLDLNRVWLATTDADSRVPSHWLRAHILQHDLGADAWSGRVIVTEWPQHRRAIAEEWQREYDVEEKPIHGANFGINAQTYVDAGGFPPLRSSEDRGLHHALVTRGARVHYDASAPVVTSARRHARAPGGFAAALSRYATPLRTV